MRAFSPVSPGLSLVTLSVAIALAACGSPPPSDADGGRPDGGVDGGTDAGPPPDPRPAEAPLTQWVDVFTGTGGTGFNDIGSTYPGPAMPFGMIHPGPDTMGETGAPLFTHCVGYAYTDPYIRAFSHTRMNGVGIADYGVVALMPTVGMTEARTTTMGHRSRYAKESERASPGFYEVTLDEGDIHVEITSGLRAAISRYTWQAGDDATVLLDVGHALQDVTIDDGAVTVVPAEREIEGFVRFSGGYSGRFGGMSVYFVARFDRDPIAHGVWQAGTLHEGETARSGPDTGAWMRFDTATDRDVEVAIGISFLDVARARLNLEAETEDEGGAPIGFDALRARAESAWEAELGRIEIEGRFERDFRIFYSALYHVMLMPTLATEADGHYRGIDGEEHVADGFTYYTDLSLWDTYRTFHPLVAWIVPDRALDFVRSMIAMAEQHGSYPRWPLGVGETFGMLGDPAVIAIADAWMRGVRGFDLMRAYELARISADGDPPSGGRGSMEAYLRLGYVPIESGGGSVSDTMEYAYADDAVATMARELGLEAEAAIYEERGRNYQNVWDAARGFFVGRQEDGAFQAELDETRWDRAYAEGNAWQYLWLAPQDPDGLAETLGGRAVALERLGTFFDEASRERRHLGPPTWYWHGNEPDLHAAFLFALWSDPDGTARWSTWARETFYGLGPTGLPGNDDGGTMSAWYVLASLGLYPIAGDDLDVVGSPLWTRAVVHAAGGDVVIEAPAAAPGVPYVRELTWDGTSIPRDRIAHSSLAGGGTLRFELSSAPPTD